jgi:hypothetical protein
MIFEAELETNCRAEDADAEVTCRFQAPITVKRRSFVNIVKCPNTSSTFKREVQTIQRDASAQGVTKQCQRGNEPT